MKCPLCQAPTDVKHTKDGIRTRECFNEHRFKTQEILLTEPKPKKQWKKSSLGRCHAGNGLCKPVWNQYSAYGFC